MACVLSLPALHAIGEPATLSVTRELPVAETVDVLVVGGGPAGVSAAVTAAEAGRRVLVIEQTGSFGGAGTVGGVPELMNFDDGEHFLAGGFGRRVHDALFPTNEPLARRCHTVNFAAMKRLYDRLVAESGAKYRFYTRLTDVVVRDGAVTHAVVSDPDGTRAIAAKVFVDATGSGFLCRLAGVPCDYGNETGAPMGTTLCSLWGGVDFERKKRDGQFAEKAWREGVLSQYDTCVPGIKRTAAGVGVGGGNVGHLFGVDDRDVAALSKAMVDGRRQLAEYETYYRRYVPGCENATLINTADTLGVRASRRVRCEKTLTLEAFRMKGRFPDEIGRYSYPIDIHPVTADKKGMKDFSKSISMRHGKGESYSIPYGALIPVGVRNVLVAGRAIGADCAMQASVRVIPGCYVTGQAAGLAAALAASRDGAVRKVPIAELRRRLLALGAYLDTGSRAAADVSVGRTGRLSVGLAGGFYAEPRVNYDNWRATAEPGLSLSNRTGYALVSRDGAMGTGAWTTVAQTDGSVLVTNRMTLAKSVRAQACGTRIFLPYANWTGCVWRTDGGKSGMFPANRTRAGLFGGRAVRSVTLVRGDETVTLAFPAPRTVTICNDAAWCDCFSVRLQDAGDFKAGDAVETVFTLSSRRPLACGQAVETVVATRGDAWLPMTMKRGIVPGGATDFSGWGLARGPAGKDGWLRRVGDHFEFERRPGEPVRFCGVNLVSSCCWPERRAEADEMVARLVRSGYNAVRLHHFECAGGIATTDDPSSTTLNPARMDQMDYLVAKLIAAGIYVTIDLYSYRTATWRSLGVDRDGSPSFIEMKPIILLTDAGYENWRRYAENLLTHVNPYTGRAYRDEPGLPLVSLVNEDHLGMGWPRIRGLECVSRFFGRDVSQLNAGAIPDFHRRAAEAETRAATRMIAFLRALGVRALVTDLNCGPFAAPEYDAIRTNLFDFADNHFYVDHPQWLGERLKLPSKRRNVNYFDYDDRSPLDLAVARRVPGLPYTITEWNFSGPSDFRHQGGLLMGATAAANRWNGLWTFTWSHSIRNVFDATAAGGIGNFDILRDPIQQANERAVVALYLRGDAAPGDAAALAKFPAEKRFTVDTPRTQGGAACAGGSFKTADLAVRLTGADAAVWATGVDLKPLRQSARILVTHATDVRNEGMEWADRARTIVLKNGGRSLLAHVGRAEIALAAAPGDWTCWALETDGTRRNRLPCARAGATLVFTADVAQDPHQATMLYELIDNTKEKHE